MTDPLARQPGYALRRAANAMMGELAARLSPLDLRISDASVLMLIARRKDASSSEIGRILDIKRANMAPLLARLEAAGLIRREPIDRKSMAILLTAAGESRLAETDRIIEQFERDLLARIPEEHRDHLLPALNALWR
ncbi:DNA-binding transcriptional regulator, MarR family [Novosphingobium sp. CF614]|uniref:MarR family winged helix-turn-helix transcriptional regulator n=1 Tax=Novosphingobium sp. CF614 TaxID=1884364 RepID=UPI0008EA0FCB|nr:MarR family transcriptional regulator [Novosphingobium sp. CF614]SFG45953.1 DNA-binding transcriptional regulator, MarR family [Novosphingobium sp. CF614]